MFDTFPVAVFIFLLSFTILQGQEEQQNATVSTSSQTSDTIPGPALSPLLRHKPIYFITGHPDTKVQFSFKYKILKKSYFHFGYSQLMYWDLFEDSSPFTDIIYNPELFYEWLTHWSILESVDMGILEHNSNGKGNIESRSYNSSYVQLNVLKALKSWEFASNLKSSFYYGIGEYNSDIGRYIGYWQIQGSVAKNFEEYLRRIELYLRVFPGGNNSFKFTKGGQELGLKMRINWPRFGVYLFIQADRGYTSSLLNYTTKEKSYRAGILF